MSRPVLDEFNIVGLEELENDIARLQSLIETEQYQLSKLIVERDIIKSKNMDKVNAVTYSDLLEKYNRGYNFGTQFKNNTYDPKVISEALDMAQRSQRRARDDGDSKDELYWQGAIAGIQALWVWVETQQSKE
jgi:hypothetical protein